MEPMEKREIRSKNPRGVSVDSLSSLLVEKLRIKLIDWQLLSVGKLPIKLTDESRVEVQNDRLELKN